MGRKPKFTSEQISYALKQVEAGVPMTEVCSNLTDSSNPSGAGLTA